MPLDFFMWGYVKCRENASLLSTTGENLYYLSDIHSKHASSHLEEIEYHMGVLQGCKCCSHEHIARISEVSTFLNKLKKITFIFHKLLHLETGDFFLYHPDNVKWNTAIMKVSLAVSLKMGNVHASYNFRFPQQWL